MAGLMDAYDLLHAGTCALSRAEQQGFRIDIEACQQKIERLGKSINKAKADLEDSELTKAWRSKYGASTNYDSNPQLSKVLYEVLGYTPPKSTRSGKGSTDEEALKQIGIAELDYLIRMRKLKKIRDTYLQAYLREQVDGFIHPSFMLHNIETYRSGSSHPNFQNVPKRDRLAMQTVRSVIFPRKGHQIVEFDLASAEVSIAATYHKDPEMLRYLNDPKSDMHADQGYVIFKLDNLGPSLNKKIPELYTLRQAAKNGFVFPEFYGDYYVNCAINMACNWGKLPNGRWSKEQGVPMPGGSTLGAHMINRGINSLDDFTNHVKEVEDEFWKKRFKVYNKWRRDWFDDYKTKGYFDMKTGFRCAGVMTRNESVNFPVQGAAFHCLLWILIRTDEIMRKENWNTRIIGEVHDSMIIDADPDELDHVAKTIYRLATEDLPRVWKWINVPINIEIEAAPIDRPWSELTAYKM